MLSFISSLFVSREDARNAFCRGEPKADSPEHANIRWSAHVRHWKKMFEVSSFDGVIPRASDRGRLGWLEDASYWKAYWGSFDALCKRSDFAKNDGLRGKMVSNCVQEAAAQSNMAFFRHVTAPIARQTVSDCLEISHQILPPAVMAWLAQSGDQKGFKVQDVVQAQDQYWRTLPWAKTTQRSPFFSQLNQPQDIDKFDATLVAGFAEHKLNRQEQVCAIGHILTHCPSEWMRPDLPGDTIVERLKTLIQPMLLPGVDIDTIAMCCGHGSNEREVFKDIKIMGKLLILGHTRIGRRRQQNPELAMLASFYELTTPWSLYDAVETSGLMHGKQAEEFSLPDMEFA